MSLVGCVSLIACKDAVVTMKGIAKALARFTAVGSGSLRVSFGGDRAHGIQYDKVCILNYISAVKRLNARLGR